jgi:hypothetical protein
MLALVSDASYEDGILLGTQFVAEHLGEGCRDGQGMAVVVDEAVGRLCPLQDNVGAVEAVEGEETAVQGLALVFEHTHGHVDAGIAQFLDAAALHFGKLVNAAYNHTAHALADNEVGAGRGLAIVGTGFEADVEGGER